MITCSKCGTINEDKSNFCESCGEILKSNNKICTECGEENVENAKFCMGCGVSLETSGSKIIGSKTQENKESESDESKDNFDRTVSLDLTPAESLVILNHGKKHGYGTSTKDLLKVTFIDLIFKNVFKVDTQEVEKKGIFGKKMVKKTYLQEGKNFNMPLKPHEEVFRKYLPNKADSKRLRKLQERVYKKYRNNYAQKLLLEPLSLEGYFSEEKKFLGKKYSLSDKGMELQEMILKLKDEGKDLENWLESDPQKAKAYLMMGGSNVFLTDDYHFDWFKNNSKKISKLFIGVAAVGLAYNFSNVQWYGAFSHSDDMDFDEFDSFDDGFSDMFSDVGTFDSFDSIDFDDFDSGFDDGGFDGGGGDFGGGE
ncbi:MAG: zinc ribbon domain-containing protein [Methanobacterium sp.]